MSTSHIRLAPFLFAVCLATIAAAATPVPNTLLHSFFDPSTNAGTKDYFGFSVAVSGTRVVVGAHGDDTGASDAGVAYVYDLASATPTVAVARLTKPTPGAGDTLAFSVAISGTLVVLGVPQDDPGAQDAGSAYVYDLASAAPSVPVVNLTNPIPTRFAFFGSAVGISGTRVVVGVPRGQALESLEVGSAYLYDLAGASPMLPVARLTNPKLQLGGNFGNSVAISGTRVAVGAPGNDQGSGSAYVYEFASAIPVANLVDPSKPGGRFGSALAVSGTRVVVGKPRDDPSGLSAGSAFVYELANDSPTVAVMTLTNPSPVSYGNFGSSVGISRTLVVIGAYGDDSGGSEVGSSYVYDLVSATPAVPLAGLNNPSPADFDYFGNSVAIDGTTVVVGAPYDDTNADDRGAAYIFGVRPELHIVPAALGAATLSWTPQTSSGFMLQYTDTFSSTNWLNAPSGAANPVSISTTNASRFYRLFQP